jgi:hypothetical protein
MAGPLVGSSDSGWGVWGGTSNGTGVAGTAGSGVGTFGESSSSYGVWGRSSTVAGVVGDTLATDSAGVWGHNRGNGPGVFGNSDGGGTGVAGSGGTGVRADGSRTGVRADGGSYGVYASSSSRAVYGYGTGGVGVLGFGAQNGTGVYGTGDTTDPSVQPQAGYFKGRVDVVGDLTVLNGNKPFKIDHPLDPQNKYLLHNAVESSERKNIYDGVTQLDADGTASVELPEWFEALNESFCYQLTPVGGAAPALHVAEEIYGNSFKIAGGEGGMKVCWQVTGTRKDPWAAANPFEVEQEKSQEERGRYLQPDLYDAPEEQRITGPLGEALLEEAPLETQQLPQPPQILLPTGFGPSPAPPMPPGFAAPGFGRQEEENRRQIDELRLQIEELRRRL